MQVKISKYTGTDLIDWAKFHFKISTGYLLAEYLGISAPNLSKIRKAHIPITAHLLVELMDTADLILKEIEVEVLKFKLLKDKYSNDFLIWNKILNQGPQ